MRALIAALLAACTHNPPPLENRSAATTNEDWPARATQLCALLGSHEVSRPPLPGIRYVGAETSKDDYAVSAWFVDEPLWIRRVIVTRREGFEGPVVSAVALDTTTVAADICRGLGVPSSHGGCEQTIANRRVVMVGTVNRMTQLSCQHGVGVL